MLTSVEHYIQHISWWQPALGAELVYLFMIGLGYSLKKFIWYPRHMRGFQTWPASITLYFFYVDWFLRNNSHLQLIIGLQMVSVLIAIPLWTWWFYINRRWNMFEKTKWFWTRDELPRLTKKQLAERDKLVQEGHTQDIFCVVPGGKQ